MLPVIMILILTFYQSSLENLDFYLHVLSRLPKHEIVKFENNLTAAFLTKCILSASSVHLYHMEFLEGQPVSCEM